MTLRDPMLDDPTPCRDGVIFHAQVELQIVNAGEFTTQHLNEYWADVLHQSVTAAHPPEWCGAFALWCLHQAGLALEQHWMFGPPHYGFLYRLEVLLPGEAPKPGDIGYQDAPYQHHFIVERVEGSDVHTIEGNQGGTHPIQAKLRKLGVKGITYYSISNLLPERDRL